MLKKYLFVGFFLFWVLLCPFFAVNSSKVFAASKCDGVIISEFMPYPASGSEWVEVFNTNEYQTDISECSLADSLDTPSHRYDIPDGTIVESKGYFVFYDNFYLNNDGPDKARLLSAGNETVSERSYNKPIPKGQSYVFNGTSWEWTKDVTPGFEKSAGGTDTPVDSGSGNTCEGLIVSELMPDPASPLTDADDEWIEIYNESGEPVNAGGCILTDTQKAGSTHEYKIAGGTLAPGGFMVFYSKDTKISLNNDGDNVRILSPDKKVIFETQNYGKAQAGQSWAYDGDKWAWTAAPTAGALNVIEILEETSVAKTSSKKTASNKRKTTASKPKTTSKPVSKTASPKKKSADGAEVLGANTEDEDSIQGKVNDKVMGYVLVTLAGVLLVGYVIYINKDFIYENSIKKFRRDG
ncbi:MAG: lamin tail domain-containing protein [bacterium]|nr:lamin tail domain-containing protein [bacterium]